MKKMIAIAALTLATVPLAAQETYEGAKIAQEDLNGTARYVGMGGAMEALGADISTLSTNPAGIGVFRRSSISVSMGVVSQDGVSSMLGGNKTNVSFDQAGFVWSNQVNRKTFLNFGFNYHKSRNFNQILSVSDRLDNASLNKLTYAKAKNGLLYNEKAGTGNLAGLSVPDFDRPYFSCTQLDDLLAYNMNFDPDAVDENGNPAPWGYYNADEYTMGRATKGYIGEYDFNLSGNLGNRVYLGLTVGLHDVHYKHYSEYQEQLPIYDVNGATLEHIGMNVADNREITGTGFDVKAGIIVRPIEASAFRIGAYVHTPTFYTLRTKNYTVVSDLMQSETPLFIDQKAAHSSHENMDANTRTNYKFRMRTPWHFGLSLGHTIGQQLALGLTYDYADHSSLDTRYITDEYYDSDYEYYYDRSESDQAMNQHTERTLKGVHTLKLGAEYKPTQDVALRIGYNYVSPQYEKGGFRDSSIDSFGTYVASSADFTNWEDTHRFTLGAGYTYQKFNVSLAYQYSQTNGKFYPFMSYDEGAGSPDNNIATGVKVKNKRNQLLLTLGYTF